MSDEREEGLVPLALKAALTSWPSVEFVRIERRWRGLNAAVEEGILIELVDVLDFWIATGLRAGCGWVRGPLVQRVTVGMLFCRSPQVKSKWALFK